MGNLCDRLLRSMFVGATVAAAMAPWNASAQSANSKVQAPALVLSFEGGLPGHTVAEVLAVLVKKPEILRQPDFLKTTYTVKSGDTVCQLLGERNYPLPCGDPIRNLIDELNPEARPSKNGLRIGQVIVLPTPPFEKYTLTTYFTKEMPRDRQLTLAGKEQAVKAEADGIVRNWSGLNAKQIDKESGNTLVRYDAYRMFLETNTEDDAISLAVMLSGVRKDSLNLKFDLVERRPVGRPQSLPTTESDWKDECTSGKLFSSPRRYRDFIEGDLTAMGSIDAAIAIAPVMVTIADVRLNEAPILATTLPAGNLSCQWTKYIPALHHSTHMAGIIASRQSTLGFTGLAPNAEVEVVEVLVATADQPPTTTFDSEREFELGRKIVETSSTSPLPVYLVALQFPASKLPMALAGRGGSLGARIAESRNLFVVAAGQDPAKPPVGLSASSPIFPQSLGDLRNVIVVTACNPCNLDNAKLMSQANYSQSSAGRSAVHVAAPGGAFIPAWVDDKFIGAAAGTSQAAAYVTGLAAVMVGLYKDTYTAGEIVKRRLQVTSQPSKWDTGDSQKVAAGVVDPVLALLDPRKHWVKDANGWRAVRIKSLSTDKVVRAKDMYGGNIESIDEGKVMRVVRTSDGQAGDRRWEIYQERWRISSNDGNQATIDRRGNLVPTGGQITLCDNTTIGWGEVFDLVIAEGGLHAKSCR